MDEIKIRVWDKKLKKMEYYGPKFYVDDEYYELNFVPTDEEGDVICQEGTNENLIAMLFTGSKDKNEKEVYEGDIVRINLGELFVVKFGLYRYSNGIDYFTEGNGFFKEREEISYREGYEKNKAKFSYLLKISLSELDENSKYEIMGNIHENPELLSDVYLPLLKED